VFQSGEDTTAVVENLNVEVFADTYTKDVADLVANTIVGLVESARRDAR